KSHEILKNAIAEPSDVGKASMPNYAALEQQATYSFYHGRSQTLAGQSDDPFFLDLRVFDLAYGCAPPYPGCAHPFSEAGHDTLNGFNVNTLVLQVPNSDVERGANHIIGVWTTAERRSIRVESSKGSITAKGAWVQVSRLGNPLVNEVVVPVGL